MTPPTPGQPFQPLRFASPWATNGLLCALGLGLGYCARELVLQPTHLTIGYSAIAAWSALLYMTAVAVVLTQPTNRWSSGIILAFASATRIYPLFAEPFLSTDIYRYVWDGIVQHAGINPYRYVPADPALAFLRTPHQEIYDHMNRREYAHTIYPPFSQLIFFAASWLSPTVQAMKLAMFVCDGVAVAAITAFLHRMGKPVSRVLLYAWCPLLAWEVAGAGHIDAAVIALVSLALLFRARGSHLLTGLFLGLAVMTKFYPLVLFPALYRRGDWKMPSAIATVVAVGYAIYSSVGTLVFGFLRGYTEEEGITTGTRYFLLQLAQSIRGFSSVSPAAYLVFCAAVFLAIAFWAWQRVTTEGPITPAQPRQTPPNFLQAAAMLGIALMLLFSPHYPWYVVWLIPFFALAPNLPLLTYLMGFFYLFTTSLAFPGPKMFLLNKILYGAILCTLAMHVALRRWFRLPSFAEAPVREK